MKITIPESPALKSDLATYQRDHLNILAQNQATNATTDPVDALGWFGASRWVDAPALAAIKHVATQIRESADVFVVVGVGGSNQAARAYLSAFGHGDGPEIVYAGNTLSATAYEQLFTRLATKRVVIDVIAKNFATLEPGLAYRLFKPWLEERYGKDYARHIVVTGTLGSDFEALANQNGYAFLPFPTDIGGRFSAFSAVGLLPLAVAGVDLPAFVQAAQACHAALQADATVTNPAYVYATWRQYWLAQGKTVELLAHFEPQLSDFARWWTQLFAESEGKAGTGLFPVPLSYSEQLHSVGQYVQQGQRQLIELFVTTDNESALKVPGNELADGFAYLTGKAVASINQTAERATIKAHLASGVPCLQLALPTLTPAVFAQLLYFFEYAAYLSGTLLGVKPFDQPGVEAYKALMFEGLGK